MTTLTIAPRFRGPPGAANGGYVAGRLAAALEEAAGDAAVEVTLRRPVPLAPQALRVVAGDEPGTARLLDEAATCRAEARRVRGASLAPPPMPRPPPREIVEAATRRFVGFRRHGVSGCFVCGPSRAAGDGLRIFAGALDADAAAGERIVAAPWVPDGAIAGAEGAWVRPEFAWAALDCPGAFAVMPQREGAARSAGMPLGRITAQRLGGVRVGEPCVVLGWPITGEAGAGSRWRFAGTAVFGVDGGLRALARAVWFLPAPAAT
jgi:hypothetical protein